MCKKCPKCGYSESLDTIKLPEDFWDNIKAGWKALYHYGDGELVLSTSTELNFEKGEPSPRLIQYTEDVTWVFEIKNIHKLRDKIYKWERP